MQEKKYLIILALKILETESDESRPLTQVEIAQAISGVYPCDRKTVGRNIRALIQIGYPVKKTAKGFYLDRKVFSVEERNFVLNAVRRAEGKSDGEKEELIHKLSDVFQKIYRQTE